MSTTNHLGEALRHLFPLLGFLVFVDGAMAQTSSPEQRRERIERRDLRMEQRRQRADPYERRMERREQRRDRQEERFDDADADGDGVINLEEARRSFPRLHTLFDEIDADRNGSLDPAEIRQFWRKRARERRIERRGEDPRY